MTNKKEVNKKMAEKPNMEEIIKVMDWLSSNNLDLEEQLQEFSLEERNRLYSHNLMEEFDLLP